MNVFTMPEFAVATVFVDENRVNLDDLCAPSRARTRIVRCSGDPHECVLYIPAEDARYEFVAGLISEAA